MTKASSVRSSAPSSAIARAGRWSSRVGPKPGIDGIELLKRAHDALPRVIGIILTGNVERLNEERMRDSVNEVLRKPQPIPALRACLERWESGLSATESLRRTAERA